MRSRILSIAPGILPVMVLAVLLGLLTGAPGESRAATCDLARLKRVQQVYQRTRSFAGRFEQEDDRGEGRIDRARGQIAYRKPGRMRWEYAPPQQQLLITDGSTLWLYDPLLDNVTIQPLRDITQGTPLAFLLGIGNLGEDFSCRALKGTPPQDGLIYLELLPRTPIPGLAYIQLGVERGTERIGALRMVDSQGGSRLLRLHDLKTGVLFPPDHFTFKVTADMEQIHP